MVPKNKVEEGKEEAKRGGEEEKKEEVLKPTKPLEHEQRASRKILTTRDIEEIVARKVKEAVNKYLNRQETPNLRA
jgi:hypothetical protein